MQRLNAIDAVAPAFTRTHQILFKPFRIGRSWKLAATSYLAFAGSFFFPFPLLFLTVAYFVPGFPRSIVPILFAATILATAIYFALFYCFVRLQLVEFEIVVTTAKMIAPMWRKYSRRVWPWIGAKVVVGVFSAALIVPIAYRSAKAFLSSFDFIAAQGQHPDPRAVAHVMSAFFGFYFLLLALFLIPKTAATLLDDFVLPFFLLEDLPLFTAIQRGFTVLAADPVSCILYLLLKCLLAVVGYLAQAVALQVCMIPVVLVLGILFVLGSLVVRHTGPAGIVLGVVAAVLLGIVAYALMFYLATLGIGYVLILLDAYAAYFLGGRYPLLGNLLEPGPSVPFTPPPVFPAPEERDDDTDDGPSLPMNPAIA